MKHFYEFVDVPSATSFLGILLRNLQNRDIVVSFHISLCRAVVRTGATGAFAPVNFQQRVLSTRPEKKRFHEFA